MSIVKRDVGFFVLSLLAASLLTFFMPKWLRVMSKRPERVESLRTCEVVLKECLNQSKPGDCADTYEDCVDQALGALSALL